MDVRNKLEQMKEQLQSQKETYVRNKGIYDSKLQELNDVFGFKNLEEAQAALEKTERKINVMSKKLEEAIEDFEEKYKDLLS